MTASARSRLPVLCETNGANAISAASEQARAERSPGLDRAEPGFVARQHGRDRERERSDAGREEPAGEQQIHRASLDEEPGCGEHRDHRGRDGNRRVERDARVRQRIAVESARCEEQQRPDPSTTDEHELADEPQPIQLRWASFHIPLIGKTGSADEGYVESILIADDHPLTREALASLLEQHGFDVVGHASDGEEAISEAGRLRPRSSCST